MGRTGVAKSKKTILILDQDDDIAKIISLEAESLGFEVRVFKDPICFIEHIPTCAPSHLAIDLIMPSLDGLALLKNLIQIDCKSSIILTSGIGTATLHDAQLTAIKHKLNVRGILDRPFNHLILKNMLSDLTSVDLFADLTTALRGQKFVVDHDTLQEALHKNEFILYYQPQVNLLSGEIIGLEGLMRWHHPQSGIKLPEVFIPIAEETGLIDQLTEIAIAQGFNFIKKLNSMLSLSLNISARSIKDNHLVQVLNKYCQQFDIAPQRVVLELTETTTMKDPEKAQDILNHLRTKGFRLSIDDFGTGYSSMAQLAQLPFSELKIDKSFVTTMEHSPKSIKVIASTINLAESLGMATIAEGIENSIAAIGLRELGCHFGQGYYFARPMDQQATVQWLKSWGAP
ncbi:GGDEF/EAL domain-containing response regulator [Methylophilus aquaticus]|uniref:EAL domain-containing response regulator n=1 Tax=Methylophilus aquaticus TaxID=1971610 RepID=A0ABT9JSG5_9PROT|nr:EAL domain-containing response regulator [Methylophilus aquaticus]MDP8567497.1 EAL domain-containing response regulator [Methylophilus aquaticus]